MYFNTFSVTVCVAERTQETAGTVQNVLHFNNSISKYRQMGNTTRNRLVNGQRLRENSGLINTERNQGEQKQVRRNQGT